MGAAGEGEGGRELPVLGWGRSPAVPGGKGGRAEPGAQPGLCWLQAAGGTSAQRKPVAYGHSTWKLRRDF